MQKSSGCFFWRRALPCKHKMLYRLMINFCIAYLRAKDFTDYTKMFRVWHILTYISYESKKLYEVHPEASRKALFNISDRPF